MGPYLAFSMSQAIVRPSTEKFPGYTHTDGGEGLRRIRVTETSRPLAMKALYLLTDVTGPESSNFTVFPGSHLRPYPEPDEPPVTRQCRDRSSPMRRIVPGPAARGHIGPNDARGLAPWAYDAAWQTSRS